MPESMTATFTEAPLLPVSWTVPAPIRFTPHELSSSVSTRGQRTVHLDDTDSWVAPQGVHRRLGETRCNGADQAKAALDASALTAQHCLVRRAGPTPEPDQHIDPNSAGHGRPGVPSRRSDWSKEVVTTSARPRRAMDRSRLALCGARGVTVYLRMMSCDLHRSSRAEHREPRLECRARLVQTCEMYAMAEPG